MPRFVIKQPNGLYAEWSTVVDNFIEINLTKAEIKKYLRQTTRDSTEILARLGRVEEFGTSAYARYPVWADCLETLREFGDKEHDAILQLIRDTVYQKG